MANRKYVIVDTSEINTIDFSQVLETNKYNLMYNNDETQFILKYEGNQPSSLTGKTEYSFNEIKLILDDINGDWYQELEF